MLFCLISEMQFWFKFEICSISKKKKGKELYNLQVNRDKNEQIPTIFQAANPFIHLLSRNNRT